MERAFEAYGAPLENVTAFRYMVRVMTTGDYDWPVVVDNLHRERRSWGKLSRILSREGTDPKVSGIFQYGYTGGLVVQGRDVVTNPQDGVGPDKFPTQGHATAHREAADDMGGWELVIPIIRGGNGGSRL